jgi:hypothetical protein
MFFLPALGTLTFFATASAYVWPSPQLDALEALRFDQTGFSVLSTTLSTFVKPCALFVFDGTVGTTSGRSNAADWIRTVRSSMASLRNYSN